MLQVILETPVAHKREGHSSFVRNAGLDLVGGAIGSAGQRRPEVKCHEPHHTADEWLIWPPKVLSS